MLGHTRARLASGSPHGEAGVHELSTSGSGSTPRFSRPGSAPGLDALQGHLNGGPSGALTPAFTALLGSELPVNGGVNGSTVLDIPPEFANAETFAGSEAVYHNLQSLLGNGNWAPWFQNSVRIHLSEDFPTLA